VCLSFAIHDDGLPRQARDRGTDTNQKEYISDSFSGTQLKSGRLAVCADHYVNQWTAYPATHYFASVITSGDSLTREKRAYFFGFHAKINVCQDWLRTFRPAHAQN
jgi:hypothetical protein